MAQPAYAIEYLGAIRVTAGTPITSATIAAAFPTATALKMDALDENGKSQWVRVSIDGGVQFDVAHGEESYLNSSVSKTYRFSRDCTIVVGVYKAVT